MQGLLCSLNVNVEDIGHPTLLEAMSKNNLDHMPPQQITKEIRQACERLFKHYKCRTLTTSSPTACLLPEPSLPQMARSTPIETTIHRRDLRRMVEREIQCCRCFLHSNAAEPGCRGCSLYEKIALLYKQPGPLTQNTVRHIGAVSPFWLLEARQRAEAMLSGSVLTDHLKGIDAILAQALQETVLTHAHLLIPTSGPEP